MHQARRALIVSLAFSALYLYSGPVASGTAFLPPPGVTSNPFVAPGEHTPLHKGGVSLSSGIYVRENDDLILAGTPALVLRRTYISGYRASKQFGIGATHPGEQYVIGDGERFQWVSLVQANGSRVHFIRSSPGTSFFNARYRHSSTTGEWNGAELGWNWGQWVLRRRDGLVMSFQSCNSKTICSLMQIRDAEGRTVLYKRDSAGRLTRMEAANRWIGFEYDAGDRIAVASASDGASVRYQYDDRGRLATVTSSSGTVRKYTYTDVDELATMTEPGTTIQNIYQNARVVRQINRFDGERRDAEPLTFDFSYHLEGEAIVRTDTRRSDGTWSSFTWDEDRRTLSETRGMDGVEPIVITYERDRFTSTVTSLTVTCPDRTGRPLRHSSVVRPGDEDRVKGRLIGMHCW